MFVISLGSVPRVPSKVGVCDRAVQSKVTLEHRENKKLQRQVPIGILPLVFCKMF